RSRLCSAVECSSRHASEQWWLVRISPSGETNEAVQLDRRMVAVRTRSSQAELMSIPWSRLTAWDGKLWKVHMPPSAKAVPQSSARSRAGRKLRRMGDPFIGRPGAPDGAGAQLCAKPRVGRAARRAPDGYSPQKPRHVSQTRR